jgi:uncharacterized protein
MTVTDDIRTLNDEPQSPVPSGPSRLEILSAEECLARLATKQIGRLAVVDGDYPQVFPVNYRIRDDVIVFRTAEHSPLLAADHHNVGFYVDQIDEMTHTGWSVLVQGKAEDVTEGTSGDGTAGDGDPSASDLRVQPWAPGNEARIVRIVANRMTGRRLTAAEFTFWSDDRGYL